EYGGGDTIQLDGDTLIESFSSDDTPVAIFGAGHVGRALVLALAPLPFSVEWFDSRIESFPRLTPQNTAKRHLAEPWEAVACLVPGTLSLVMTHSHPLDLALCDALLKRDDMPFIGLIGSNTKKKRFYSQLRDLSHMQSEIDRITCPIGLSEITDKQPAAIAASVTAQLLMKREELAVVQTTRNAMAEA
ncbi:MAG: xanthine dehydrogenase accessory protein XdhC, partial [Pseudomonadota bacterium]